MAPPPLVSDEAASVVLVASPAGATAEKHVLNGYALPPDEPILQTGRAGLTAVQSASVVHGSQHHATKSATQRPAPRPHVAPLGLPVQSSEQKAEPPTSPPTQKSPAQSPPVLQAWPNAPVPGLVQAASRIVKNAMAFKD